MVSDIIGQTTPVELGIVVAVVAGFVGGIWKAVSSFTAMSNRLDLLTLELQMRLKALEKAVETDDCVTRAEVRAWTHDLRGANPGLNVPPFDDAPQTRRKD